MGLGFIFLLLYLNVCVILDVSWFVLMFMCKNEMKMWCFNFIVNIVVILGLSLMC